MMSQGSNHTSSADGQLNLSVASSAEDFVQEYTSVLFEFIIPGVLLNTIGLLGLVGNVISIVVLSRPQMKSSINVILIGLASADTILITTSILMFGLPAVNEFNASLFTYYFKSVFPYIMPIIYPVGMIAQTGSVYLTLCVTVERYVAVCLPLRARSICTYGRACAYVAVIVVFSTLYNLPRFWEVEWKTFPAQQGGGENETVPWPTELRNNDVYIGVYMTWLYLVVMNIVPFLSLAVFNLAIYLEVRRANSERAQLTRLQQKEVGLATMLMVVVLVFFICNILALVVNILEVLGITVMKLNNISNLLVTLNSSVNFIIYCIFGDKFKRIFLRLFCSQVIKAGGHHLDFINKYQAGEQLSFQGNNRCHAHNANNGDNNGGHGGNGHGGMYNGASSSRLRTQSTYDMSTFRGSRQSITTLYPSGRESSSCYRDDSVVSVGNRYNGGGTNNIGNGGHLSVASAASLDSEARRFSIDSGDVRADFYSKKKKKKRRAFLGYKDKGESHSEAAPLSPDPAEDEEPISTSNCYTQTTPAPEDRKQQQQRDSQRRAKQYLNFPPPESNSAAIASAAEDDDSGNGGESSFEVRPLIHPQKPTDITITVNINACLSGVAAGTTAAAATAELDAADITSSVVAAAAEQKWKSSNVKAVVANGKSIGFGEGITPAESWDNSTDEEKRQLGVSVLSQ